MKINIQCEPEDIGALLLSIVKSADDANRILWERLEPKPMPAPIHIDPNFLKSPDGSGE